jgi:hypothetical protein
VILNSSIVNFKFFNSKSNLKYMCSIAAYYKLKILVDQMIHNSSERIKAKESIIYIEIAKLI